MPTIIDNDTGDILSDAIRNLPTRAERQAQYRSVMDDLLDPMSAPWPSDGFPNMAQRVAMVARMSPQSRAANGLRAKHAIPDGLTTFEARHWIEGERQAGG